MYNEDDMPMTGLHVPTVLSIAGSDPSGGAGIQSDLRTFQLMNVYGLSVPAALTAQNTEGVCRVEEVSANFLAEQIDVLIRDIRPDALKTGMLYSAANIETVADRVSVHGLENLVVDPLAVSSTGVSLVSKEGVEAIRSILMPLARIITPNIHEAALFAGMEIVTEQDRRDAAVILQKSGPEAVIITGGHLEACASDLMFDGREFLFLERDILAGKFHGTGCVFSAALASALARGFGNEEAFAAAKEFTYSAMVSAASPGRGMKILNMPDGPVNADNE